MTMTVTVTVTVTMTVTVTVTVTVIYILPFDTAEIHFTVRVQIGEPEAHYNLAWVNADDDDEIPEDLEDAIITGPTSPVVFMVPSFDISSSTGGTIIRARAILQDITGEAYILSWQVE